MALPGKSKQSEEIKNTKTRRGYGQKNKRRKRTNQINLSLIGTNSAGLTSKKESFYSIINKYKPSILTVQETKHKKVGLLKIPGYQTFEKAVDEDLNPVLISNCKEDIEILTIEAEIGAKGLRIINGYGPQEDDETQEILCFWQEMEAEVIRAKDDGCYVQRLGKELLKEILTI